MSRKADCYHSAPMGNFLRSFKMIFPITAAWLRMKRHARQSKTISKFLIICSGNRRALDTFSCSLHAAILEKLTAASIVTIPLAILESGARCLPACLRSYARRRRSTCNCPQFRDFLICERRSSVAWTAYYGCDASPRSLNELAFELRRPGNSREIDVGRSVDAVAQCRIGRACLLDQRAYRRLNR